MNKKLKRGMILILVANIINLVFNLLTNFLLPKYLSVNSYSAIKTFQLYGMYIGIFSLGCADGMYLRYGGKNISEINESELKGSLDTFRFFLIVENLFFVLLAFWIKDRVITATVLTIISLNMTGYFKNLYQASGEFKRYGNILNITTSITFLVNVVLLFGFKTDNYVYFLIGYVVVDAAIWLALEYYAAKLWKEKKRIKYEWNLFFADVKNGILLMVGNFSSTLLTSMDRWFVKALMTSIDFAQYSFAVSLEGFLNTAITPITVTLYNYFCNSNDKETVVNTRRYVLIFSSIIIAAAFPAKFVISIYLEKYLGAVKVLFILFGAQLFYVPIKAVYVNLYKAKGKQTLYFIRLVSILVIGAILNVLFVHFYPYKEAFAYGTLVSAFVWMIFSILDFKEYKISCNEIVYCVAELLVFIVLGYGFDSIVGLFLYCVISVVLMAVLLNNEMKYILTILTSYSKKIVRKSRGA